MELISFEKNGHIGLIKINRPKALNALNAQVLSELNELLNQVDRDKDLRCLILTGEGDKAFVAGADIKEMESLDSSQARAFGEKGQKVFRRLEILNLPIIAAVNGFALGGGLELAMACDFIVASENARFGLPEVSLGLIPGFGGTVRLPRYVGLQKAREMIFTGNHYKADAALAMGLVSQIVPATELLEICIKLAETIAAKGPVAIARAKQSALFSYDVRIDEGMEIERDNFADLFRTEDCKIGLTAFLNKETPKFIGE